MQCARNWGLRMTAVRARMPCRIAHEDVQRVASIIAEEVRRHHKEHPRDACRDEVQYIVHTCRHTPKVEIALILVAKHGIHRIRRTIEYGKRRTAERKEEERCYHTVHRIFRHGLNCRARRIRLIELCRVTPNNVADVLPCRCKIALDQQCVNVLPRLCKHTRRNTEVEQDHADQIRAPRNGQLASRKQQPLCTCVRYTKYEQSEKCPHRKFTLIASVCGIEQSIQPTDQTTKYRNGMPARLRVAKHGIEKECRHGNERGRDHRFPSTIACSFSISRLAHTVSARRS